jgi:hypothetical protein
MNESYASDSEVMRLKFELAQAQNKISRLGQELASNRPVHSRLDQLAATSPVDTELPGGVQPAPTVPRITSLHSTNTGTQYNSREGGYPWSGYDDSRSDTSDALSVTGFNRPPNIWGGVKQAQSGLARGGMPPPEMPQSNPWFGRAASHGYVESSMTYDPATAGNYRPERLTPDFDLTTKPPGTRRGNRYDNRFGGQGYGGAAPAYGSQPGYGGYNYPQGQYESGPIASGGSQNGIGAGVYSNYQAAPVGTPLSPLASEFTSMSGNPGPWKSEVN